LGNLTNVHLQISKLWDVAHAFETPNQPLFDPYTVGSKVDPGQVDLWQLDNL
jgi:hypothetical protein